MAAVSQFKVYPEAAASTGQDGVAIYWLSDGSREVLRHEPLRAAELPGRGGHLPGRNKASLHAPREIGAEQDVSEPMSEFPSRDEMAARLEAAEARADAKVAQVLGEIKAGFARLEGEMARLSGKIESVEATTSGIKATVVVTGIAAVGLVLATLTYGQNWFGIGVTTRDVVKSAVAEYLHQQSAAAPK